MPCEPLDAVEHQPKEAYRQVALGRLEDEVSRMPDEAPSARSLPRDPRGNYHARAFMEESYGEKEKYKNRKLEGRWSKGGDRQVEEVNSFGSGNEKDLKDLLARVGECF